MGACKGDMNSCSPLIPPPHPESQKKYWQNVFFSPYRELLLSICGALFLLWGAFCFFLWVVDVFWTCPTYKKFYGCPWLMITFNITKCRVLVTNVCLCVRNTCQRLSQIWLNIMHLKCMHCCLHIGIVLYMCCTCGFSNCRQHSESDSSTTALLLNW